jgi:hypothetical protein
MQSARLEPSLPIVHPLAVKAKAAHIPEQPTMMTEASKTRMTLRRIVSRMLSFSALMATMAVTVANPREF